MTSQDPEYERRLHEQNMALAQRMHDQEFVFMQSVAKAAVNSGIFALRTLVLINGGAAIALLAFVGGLATIDDAQFRERLADLTAPLLWFVWGVVAATVSIFFGYLTNYCTASGSAKKERIWDHPWVEDTKASRTWEGFSNLFQVLAIVAGAASLWFFVQGMLEIRDVVTFLQVQMLDFRDFW